MESLRTYDICWKNRTMPKLNENNLTNHRHYETVTFTTGERFSAMVIVSMAGCWSWPVIIDTALTVIALHIPTTNIF